MGVIMVKMQVIIYGKKKSILLVVKRKRGQMFAYHYGDWSVLLSVVNSWRVITTLIKKFDHQCQLCSHGLNALRFLLCIEHCTTDED
jgi:cobyric acid synthase